MPDDTAIIPAIEQLAPDSATPDNASFLQSLGDDVWDATDNTPAPETPAPVTAKPAEATTPATKSTDDLIKEAEDGLAQGKNPRSPHWEAVKSAKAAAEKERDDYKKQLDDLKSATPSEDLEKKALTEKLTSLEQQQVEYENKIRALDVQQSREFNESVNIPAEQVIGSLKAFCVRAGVSETEAVDAYLNPDPKTRSAALSELASSMNRVDEMEFLAGANRFTEIMALRHQILSNAPRAWEELQAKQASSLAAEKLASRNQWRADASKTWDAISTKLADQIKDIPEAAAIKDQVLGLDFDAVPVAERAYSIQAGKLLPHLVKQNRAVAAKVRELETALAKYTAATPGAAAHTTTSSTTGKDGRSFTDVMMDG